VDYDALETKNSPMKNSSQVCGSRVFLSGRIRIATIEETGRISAIAMERHEAAHSTNGAGNRVLEVISTHFPPPAQGES
jgi:hypothetical protein